MWYGNNYSFMVTPIMFALAAFFWLFLSLPSHMDTETSSKNSYFRVISLKRFANEKSVGASALLLLKSVLKGAKLSLQSANLSGSGEGMQSHYTLIGKFLCI